MNLFPAILIAKVTLHLIKVILLAVSSVVFTERPHEDHRYQADQKDHHHERIKNGKPTKIGSDLQIYQGEGEYLSVKCYDGTVEGSSCLQHIPTLTENVKTYSVLMWGFSCLAQECAVEIQFTKDVIAVGKVVFFTKTTHDITEYVVFLEVDSQWVSLPPVPEGLSTVVSAEGTFVTGYFRPVVGSRFRIDIKNSDEKHQKPETFTVRVAPPCRGAAELTSVEVVGVGTTLAGIDTLPVDFISIGDSVTLYVGELVCVGPSGRSPVTVVVKEKEALDGTLAPQGEFIDAGWNGIFTLVGLRARTVYTIEISMGDTTSKPLEFRSGLPTNPSAPLNLRQPMESGGSTA